MDARHRSILRQSLAIACGLVCAVLVWNLAACVLFLDPTGFTMHPALGRILRAGTYINGIEGYSWSHVNSLGIRGPEVTPPKPGERRVLFIGDSQTAGFQVPASKTFAALVGDQLRARGLNVTTINDGRSGQSPAAYIYLAPWYRRHVCDDLTVVQVSDFDFSADMLNHASAYYVVPDGNGYRSVFNTGYPPLPGTVRRLPLLKPVVMAALGVPLVRLATDNVLKMEGGSGGEDAVSSDLPTMTDPALVDWTVRELGVVYRDPTIVYLPQADYFGDPSAKTPIERELLAAGARYGVTVVDVREDMVRAFRTGFEVARGFPNSSPGAGHLNEDGHRMVADRLAPLLAKRLSR